MDGDAAQVLVTAQKKKKKGAVYSTEAQGGKKNIFRPNKVNEA